MKIGSKITELHVQKSWSKSELAKRLEVSRKTAGRYEHNDTVPSIEIAKRIADALEVSLHFLVGITEQELDQATLKRLQEVKWLSEENKKLEDTFLDLFITKTKQQSVL